MLNGPKIKVETLLYGRMQHVKYIIQQHQEKEENFVISCRVCPLWFRVASEEIQSGWVEINLDCTNTAIEMAHKYIEENKKEVKLSEEFKQHAALFSNEEARKFPPSCKWDHKIKLTEHVPTSFNCKVYPMSQK
jgi:hypothetical protein